MPLESNLATPPGVNILHRLTIENTSKFNISKASRGIYTASLGSRKGCILLLVRSNWDSGCHGNIYVLMEKKSKIFLIKLHTEFIGGYTVGQHSRIHIQELKLLVALNLPQAGLLLQLVV